MKKIVLEIKGNDVKITSLNCAKMDEAIAARAFLAHVKELGLPVSYLEKLLCVKFVQVDKVCKPGEENG